MISFLGIISLSFFRWWENRKGVKFLGEKREQLDRFIKRGSMRLIRSGYYFFERSLSMILTQSVNLFWHIIQQVRIFLEKKLVRVLDLIRGKGSLKKKGSASFFLQNVSEYKQTLRDLGDRKE